MPDIEHEREQLRRSTMLNLLYTAYPGPIGSGLLLQGLTDDLKCSLECCARDLHYLASKRWITLEKHRPHERILISTLTAEGVNACEAEPDFDRIRLRNLRLLRLRVLQALDWGRPQPLGVRLIQRALADDTDLDLGEPSLNRVLAYLIQVGLAEDCQGLTAITAAGVDYIAGDGDGQPGIARPLDW